MNHLIQYPPPPPPHPLSKQLFFRVRLNVGLPQRVNCKADIRTHKTKFTITIIQVIFTHRFYSLTLHTKKSTKSCLLVTVLLVNSFSTTAFCTSLPLTTVSKRLNLPETFILRTLVYIRMHGKVRNQAGRKALRKTVNLSLRNMTSHRQEQLKFTQD